MIIIRYSVFLLLLFIFTIRGDAQDSTPKEPLTVDELAQRVVFIANLENGGTGSGVIVNSAGLIYTNSHVADCGQNFLIYVAENAMTPPSLKYLAKVDSIYPNTGYLDFAKLQIVQQDVTIEASQSESGITYKINGNPVESLNLPFLPVTNRPNLTIGDDVRIIGFPGDRLYAGDAPPFRMTFGRITAGEVTEQGQARYYLTDAQILPGNSGGAAIDSEGNYFGIPTASTIVQSELGTELGTGVIFPVASQLAAADIVRGSEYICDNPPERPQVPPQPTAITTQPPPPPTAKPEVEFPDAIVAFIYAPATEAMPTGDWEQRQVYVLNPLTGGQPRQLTDCGLNWDPAISPDGTKIAYASTCDDGNNSNRDAELWVMNIDGSGKQQLTTTEGSETGVGNWSPDGTRLVYQYSGPETNGSYDIYTINADGSGAQPLVAANTPGYELYPVWSPDGETIAFATSPQERDAPIQLCFVPADGTGTKTCPITYGTHDAVWFVQRPAWTPDSRSVLYRYDNDSIYVAAIDGSSPQELGANVPAWKSFPQLSADGRFLFFNGGFEAEGWFGSIIRLDLTNGQFDSFGIQGGSAWNISVFFLP